RRRRADVVAVDQGGPHPLLEGRRGQALPPVRPGGVPGRPGGGWRLMTQLPIDGRGVTLSLRPEPPGADDFGPPDARLRLLPNMLLLYGWRVLTLEPPPSRAAGPEGGER